MRVSEGSRRIIILARNAPEPKNPESIDTGICLAAAMALCLFPGGVGEKEESIKEACPWKALKACESVCTDAAHGPDGHRSNLWECVATTRSREKREVREGNRRGSKIN